MTLNQSFYFPHKIHNSCVLLTTIYYYYHYYYLLCNLINRQACKSYARGLVKNYLIHRLQT